jgi:3-dehydroquinate synthase
MISFDPNSTKITYALSFVTELKKRNNPLFIITDENCYALYQNEILNLVDEKSLFVMKTGEYSKEFSTYQAILLSLSTKPVHKDTILVGFGGGIVCDMTGFVAGTYLRGITHVLVPTTVIAQVDASFGGKCGINLGEIKNQVGLFYPADEIILDFQVLKTLSKELISEGYAEIIKMALTLDKDFFEALEKKNITLEDSIKKALELKRKVVLQDPLDKGIRHVLNFGHTYGHAIETKSNFSISHGQAVGYGMLLELTKDSLRDRVEKVLSSYGLKIKVPYPREELIQYLSFDKKNTGKVIETFVVDEIGKAHQEQLFLERR